MYKHVSCSWLYVQLVIGWYALRNYYRRKNSFESSN